MVKRTIVNRISLPLKLIFENAYALSDDANTPMSTGGSVNSSVFLKPEIMVAVYLASERSNAAE